VSAVVESHACAQDAQAWGTLGWDLLEPMVSAVVESHACAQDAQAWGTLRLGDANGNLGLLLGYYGNVAHSCAAKNSAVAVDF
jgi:hypothetical protein